MTPSDILFLGLGGAGNRILDALPRDGDRVPRTAAVDCDTAVLETSRAATRVQVGLGLTRGQGTGGDALVGARALSGDIEKVHALLDNVACLFCVAGLGGGLGSGGLPAVLEAAAERDVASLSVLTLPFAFEGAERRAAARGILPEIREAGNALVVLPNDRLFAASAQTPAGQAFEASDRAVAKALHVLWRMLAWPACLALDFGCIQRVARPDMGLATLAWGEGQGRQRAAVAAERLLQSPLLDPEHDLETASASLLTILGGEDLTLHDVGLASETLRAAMPAERHPAVGVSIDPALKGHAIAALLVARPVGSFLPESRRASFPPNKTETVGRKPSVPPSGQPRGRKAEQTVMVLEPTGRGRFRDTDPTLMDGEDLDIPTYQRRGIRLSTS